jgi:hypothetical protein
MDTSLLCFFYYKASIGGVHHVYEPGQGRVGGEDEGERPENVETVNRKAEIR